MTDGVARAVATRAFAPWLMLGSRARFHYGAEPLRVSTDLDVSVNARVVSGAVADFVLSIEGRGFSLGGASPDGIAHRYRRGGVSVDVLAPEGVGSRVKLTTTPP